MMVTSVGIEVRQVANENYIARAFFRRNENSSGIFTISKLNIKVHRSIERVGGQ